MTRPISDLDVPLADVVQHAARQRAVRTLWEARVSTAWWCESDRIAYAHDVWLIEHPEACSTDADYPGWAEHIAALQAANHTAQQAHLEAS